MNALPCPFFRSLCCVCFCVLLCAMQPKPALAADYSQWNGEWAISLEKTWALKPEGLAANVRAALEKAVQEDAYARIIIEPQNNTLQFALYAPDAKKPGEQTKRIAWEGQLVPPGNGSTLPMFTENTSAPPGAAAQTIHLQQNNTLLWSPKGLDAQVVLIKRAAPSSDTPLVQQNAPKDETSSIPQLARQQVEQNAFITTPQAERLFEEACKAMPLTTNTKDKARIERGLDLYAKAAKEGHFEAQYATSMLLAGLERYTEMYPYLRVLDTPEGDTLQLRPQELAKAGIPQGAAFGATHKDMMYGLLCRLHLLGLGTKQDYEKARQANDKMNSPMFKMDASPFANPLSAKSQYTFWTVVQDMPDSFQFLQNAAEQGDVNAQLSMIEQLKKDTIPGERILEFCEQTASAKTPLLNMYAAEFVLLGHSGSVNIGKVQKFVTDTLNAPEDTGLSYVREQAAAYKQALDTPNATEGTKQLAALLRKKYGYAPAWMATAQEQEIEQGILKTPLQPGFVETLTETDRKQKQGFDVTQDKLHYVKQLLKNKQAVSLAMRTYFIHGLQMLHTQEADTLAHQLNNYKMDYYPPAQVIRAKTLLTELQEIKITNEKERPLYTTKQILLPAVEKNYPPALVAFARASLIEAGKTKKDIPLAMEYCMRAVRMGEREGYACLGEIYTKELSFIEGAKGKAHIFMEQAAGNSAPPTAKPASSAATNKALFENIAKQHLAGVKQALKAGADVNAVDKNDQTPLRLAANLDSNEIVQELLHAGANVNAQAQRDGVTAVYEATWSKNQHILETLIKAGADINLARKDGFTPLMMAVNTTTDIHAYWKEHPAIVLIQAGADVNAVDNKGNSALLQAIQDPLRDTLVPALLKAGARANVHNKEGKSLLELAREEYASKETLEMLQKAGAQ